MRVVISAIIILAAIAAAVFFLYPRGGDAPAPQLSEAPAEQQLDQPRGSHDQGSRERPLGWLGRAPRRVGGRGGEGSRGLGGIPPRLAFHMVTRLFS